MANIYKGEVSLEIDGATYTLHAGINAIADAESVFSTVDHRVTFQTIVKEAEAGSVTHIRALLWAMLRRHHKNLSLSDVGDLIDRVGLFAINERFEAVLQSFVADPEDLKSLGVGSNPPQAQAKRQKAGTSGHSASKRAASV